MFRVIYKLICFFGITVNAIAADYYGQPTGMMLQVEVLSFVIIT